MTFDLDLMRKILIGIGGMPAGGDFNENSLAGEDPDRVAYHLQQMARAGLIFGNDPSSLGGSAYEADGLTMDGSAILDGIRDDTTWAKIKKFSKEKSLDLTIEVLKAAGKAGIAKYFPGIFD